MARYQLCAVLATALMTTSSLRAQDTAPVFSMLQGNWSGEGTLMGRSARFSMRWEQSHGFAVLTFRNAFADTTGKLTPVLQSAAVYRTSLAQPEAVWLDSRRVRAEITWEALDSALIANWTAPTEKGRTTYRVLTSNELEVVDEVLSGSGWRTFATARYRRERAVKPTP